MTLLIFWQKSHLAHPRIMALALVLLFTPTALKATECCQIPGMVEDLILRGDFERAIDSLIEIEFSDSALPNRISSALVSARLYELSGKPETSIRLIERLISREASNLSSDSRKTLRMEQMRLLLLRKEVEPAHNLAKEINYQLSKLPSDEDLYTPTFYKSPAVSAAASAILPGSGQILQGRPQDALSTWIMIGIPLTLGVKARKSGEHSFANAMGILSGFFYLGNIASAYRTAEKTVIGVRAERWEKTINEQIDPAYGDAIKSLGFSIEVSHALSK